MQRWMELTGLAANALARGVLLWPVVPKLHQSEHLFADLVFRANPRFCRVAFLYFMCGGC